MSKNNVSELDVVAANNSDIAGISILGTGLVSTADDSFRAYGAVMAKWWDDLGGVNTVAGTGDAITVTTPTVYTALKTGMRMVFIAGAINTTAVTLNLDAIGAKAVRKISGGVDVALSAGDIPAGARVDVIYSAAANSAAGGWVIIAITTTVSSATTSAQGIVELATVAETITATDATRAVTPAGIGGYFANGQIPFPATQNPSANANTLDDYEEGTWTPTFVSSGATFSYSSQIGTYTKIGDRVLVDWRILLNGSGNTLSGNSLSVSGLPFAYGGSVSLGMYVQWAAMSGTFVTMGGSVAAGASDIAIVNAAVAAISGSTMTFSNQLSTTAGSSLRSTFHYKV